MPSDPNNPLTLRDWLEAGLLFATMLMLLIAVPLMGG